MATQAQVLALAAGAVTIRFENRYRHKNGSYRWLQWNARTIPRGERIYATARDVTWEKQLEREVLEVGDRERERLGRELHDGLCQMLAGTAALSATLSRDLEASSRPTAAAAAAEIQILLNEAIVQARDLARGLHPVGIGARDLTGALAALANRTRRQFGVSCAFACPSPPPTLPGDTDGHLFRIAQEAVNNAVSHGRPSRVGMALCCKERRGLLRVWDNGIGLPRKAGGALGVGMHTMAARARLIGGSLEVARRLPHGTTVTCAFPLPETSATLTHRDDAHETR